MNLKSFTKVNVATNTRYAVFDGENFIEDFTVNYLEEESKAHKALLKRFDYEEMGAIVQHVDVHKGILEVTLQIKGVRK